MSNIVEYTRNLAKPSEVIEHLRACDMSFMPPLSTRCDISEYACKLIASSQRFEAWINTSLVGMLAIYCNQKITSPAYISNISVLPSFQGRGIAKQLMSNCFSFTKLLGYTTIELNVDQSNKHAIALYVKYGFRSACMEGSSALMRLALEHPAS